MTKWNTLSADYSTFSIAHRGDNGVVDYLMYRFCPGGTMEVVDIAVNSQRGVGRGSAMMRELEGIARREGIYAIYAFTRYSNDGAHRFYERLEYSPVATLPFFYEDEDAIIYLKRF